MKVWDRGRYSLLLAYDGRQEIEGGRYDRFWYAFLRDGRPLFAGDLYFAAVDGRARVDDEVVREHILWMVTRHPDDKSVRPLFSGYTTEQLAWACSKEAEELRRSLPMKR